MNKPDPQRVAIILGSADGLCLAVSVIASLAKNQPAIWHAGLGDGLGELVGMFAALYLSATPDRTGFWPAVWCGVASLAGCALPCIPFIFLHNNTVLPFILAGLITMVVGGIISHLRPEKGIGSIILTYGVLIGAGLLAWAGSFT